MNNIEITNYLRGFTPVGGGSRIQGGAELSDIGLKLTMEGIATFYKSLRDLMPNGIVDITVMDCSASMTHIGRIYKEYNSDKSFPKHRYDLVYQSIFDSVGIEADCNILEIGLGTNNPDIVSHMGRAGTPGASLFAYRDFFTNANIFGADIDKRILFESDRIKTTWVDQLNIESFEVMHNNLGNPELDIFIEDGLHSVPASLNSLNYAIKHVKQGGFIILEDLFNPDNIWQTIATFIRAVHTFERVELINAGGLMLVIKV
tara:strand:+ start:895 stop:1674 length:780 start_codon:yes stop_codon:yes gene_type:complete